MRVLVVSRTRMGASSVCVGAIDLATGRSLRLFKDGTYLPTTHQIRPGDIWNLEYAARLSVVPPHVEDVEVTSGSRERTGEDLRPYIEALATVWRGSLHSIFDGTLEVEDAPGKAFLREGARLPGCSTGYWLADQDVYRSDGSYGTDYRFPNETEVRWVKYVGMEPAASSIPAGSLIRFSLAGWRYVPPGVPERRCYLQLSGWVP